MKRNLNLCWLLLLIFVPVLIYLSFKSRQTFKHYEELRKDLILSEYRIKKYVYRFNRELYTENLTLRDLYLTDLNNDTVPIKSLVTSSKLIYRFSNQSCSACVADDIKYLRELGDSIGYQNIIIISDYENTRLLNIFRNSTGINFPCYNFTGSFNLSIETDSDIKKTPFFFLLDEKLKIQYAFLADEYPELNEIYFSRIRAFFRKGF
ncbi:MAG: hypothetical protein D4R64_16250 [Porphyromonadaceae bacterium]|nr:MAG: hypothetical protein D4R64_16250 [Porphyromonadaceae bacterium]